MDALVGRLGTAVGAMIHQIWRASGKQGFHPAVILHSYDYPIPDGLHGKKSAWHMSHGDSKYRAITEAWRGSAGFLDALRIIASVIASLQLVVRSLADLVGLIALWVTRRQSLEAQNQLLRLELALFMKRVIRTARVDAATRLSLPLLSWRSEWRDALVGKLGFTLFARPANTVEERAWKLRFQVPARLRRRAALHLIR